MSNDNKEQNMNKLALTMTGEATDALHVAQNQVSNMMASLPVVKPSFDFVPAGAQTVNELVTLASILHKSEMIGSRDNMAKLVTRLIIGQCMGLKPDESLKGLYVVEGKPVLDYALTSKLVKQSGKYRYTVKEWTTTRVEIEWYERVDLQWTLVGVSSFDWDDAQRAGLTGKATWKSHPKMMLMSKAISQGARVYCADAVSGGVYDEDDSEVFSAMSSAPGDQSVPEDVKVEPATTAAKVSSRLNKRKPISPVESNVAGENANGEGVEVRDVPPADEDGVVIEADARFVDADEDGSHKPTEQLEDLAEVAEVTEDVVPEAPYLTMGRAKGVPTTNGTLLVKASPSPVHDHIALSIFGDGLEGKVEVDIPVTSNTKQGIEQAVVDAVRSALVDARIKEPTPDPS